MRTRRAELGITLDQLAQSAGVSAGALSRIERGTLNTSLQNAVAIATSLSSELSDLLEPEAALTVTRHGAAQEFHDPDSGVRRTLLGRPGPGAELVRYTVPGHSATAQFPPHRARTLETFHILTGRICVFAEEEELTTLTAGDTAQVPGDRRHHLSNPDPREAQLILLTTSPR